MSTSLNLHHIQRIRLARDDLERMVLHLPDHVFDEVVKGCTVKVLLEEENQARVYRIAWIAGVDQTVNPYKFGATINTAKTLVLDFSIFKMSYQMNTISNSEFTEDEFRLWVNTCGHALPITVEAAERKALELRSVWENYPEAANGRQTGRRRPQQPAPPRAPPGTGVPPPTIRRTEGMVSTQLQELLDQFFLQHPRLTPDQKQLVTVFGSAVDEYIAKEKQRMNHAIRRAQQSATAAVAPASTPAAPAGSTDTGVSLHGDLDAMSIEELKRTVQQLEEMRKVVTEKIDEKSKCIACMEHDARIVLLPCKHQVLCKICSDKLKDCPMCRTPISDRLDPFRP